MDLIITLAGDIASVRELAMDALHRPADGVRQFTRPDACPHMVEAPVHLVRENRNADVRTALTRR